MDLEKLFVSVFNQWVNESNVLSDQVWVSFEAHVNEIEARLLTA